MTDPAPAAADPGTDRAEAHVRIEYPHGVVEEYRGRLTTLDITRGWPREQAGWSMHLGWDGPPELTVDGRASPP